MTEVKKQQYLVMYEYVSDVAERRGAFRDKHIATVDSYRAKGHIAQSGPFDPLTGACLLFAVESRDTVERFLSEDPYVLNKLVTKHTVYKWDVRANPHAEQPQTNTAGISGVVVHDLESYALSVNQRNDARAELAKARDEIATLKNQLELANKSLAQMRKERDALQDQVDSSAPMDVLELLQSVDVEEYKKDDRQALALVKELKRLTPPQIKYNAVRQLIAEKDISKLTSQEAVEFLILAKQTKP